MYTKPKGTPNLATPSRKEVTAVTTIVALTIIAWVINTTDVTKFMARLFTHPLSFISNRSAAGYYLDQGMAYAEASAWLTAVESYDKSIQLRDDNAEAYYRRGVAYHQLHAIEASLLDLVRAIELNPQYAEAYYEKGWILSEIGSEERALSDFAMALSFKPDYFEVYTARGTLYFNKMEWAAVIDDMTNAIRLLPETLTPEEAANFYEMRGLAYFSTGQISEGILDFNTGIDIDPLRTENLKRHLTGLNADLSKLDPQSETYKQLEQLIARINAD